MVFVVIIAVGAYAVQRTGFFNGVHHSSSSSTNISSKSSNKKSSSSMPRSRNSSSALQSSSSNSASRTSQANVSWSSIDLNDQIAILVQVAFANKNGSPDQRFSFQNNYWSMTGSVNNGQINRYVPNTDSFSGISDLLSAKIVIDQGRILVTRPITAPFSMTLADAVSRFYNSNSRTYTSQIASKVVPPAKLDQMRSGK